MNFAEREIVRIGEIKLTLKKNMRLQVNLSLLHVTLRLATKLAKS